MNLNDDLKEPNILLIVSDLHLSEGWDEGTKKLSPNEDFFFDTSFERFLSSFSESARKEARRISLIISGDFMDFLQVLSRPKEEDKVESEAITRQERTFGLGTSPKKTCWKLWKIMNGHWIFFKALAEFLEAGNEVVIIPGNHDIEFSIVEVQKCLRYEMKKFIPDAPQLADMNLRFLPWFYYEPGLIYIEHGHQYDSLNSFDYFLHPYIPDKKGEELIDLPAGSFFVRYLFNWVETDYPFADNMKPVGRFMRWSLWKWQMWRQFPVYISFFWQILKKAKRHSPQWEKEQETLQQKLLSRVAKDSGIKEEKLLKIQSYWEKSAFHHLGKVRLALRFFQSESGKDNYSKIAQDISEILGVKYVVFGHTHKADITPVEVGTTKAEYINSGTWTKVFAENYEERLLKEENEFVFIKIDKSKPKMELLRWRDDLGKGERVRLFQPTKRLKQK